MLIAALAFLYAAFHMAALNGVSVSGTIAAPWSVQATWHERQAQGGFEALLAALGPAAEDFSGNSLRRLMALAEETAQTAPNGDEIRALMADIQESRDRADELNRTAREIKSTWSARIPFLPQLPMEPWNFRTVHIAGALALGFLLFAAHTFPPGATATAGPARGMRPLTLVAAAFAIPALVAAVTARSASSARSTPTTASSGRPPRSPRPTSSCSSSSRPSCRPRRSATTSSTSPSPRPAARAAARPRWRSSPPA
jgi:hypothetical protein